MARITVEDCLKRIDNRFKLVNAAANRVRQIREGSEYLVVSPKNEDIVVALREIAAGRVLMQDDIAVLADIETEDAVTEELEAEAAEIDEEAGEAAEEIEEEEENEKSE